MDYKLGIIPLNKKNANVEYARANRDMIIHELVKAYIDEHAGILDEPTVWEAFKGKKAVMCQSHQGGEPHKVYIQGVESFIELLGKKVETRYIVRGVRNKRDGKSYKCQSGDLTVIEEEELEI